MEKMKGTRAVKLDTMCGLIPCKIVKFIKYYNLTSKHGVENVPSSGTVLQVEVTKDSYGFKKGEILDYWSIHVIPTHKIVQNRYSSYIKGFRINDYFLDEKIPNSLTLLPVNA